VSGILIRRAEADDAEAIENVRFEGWRHTYRDLIPEAYFTAWDHAGYVWMRRRTGFPAGHGVFVAEDAGRVVAYLTAGPCRDAGSPGVGEIWAVYALPAYIGAGLGHRLMARGLEHLERFPRTVVWMLRDNPIAPAFYAAVGFRADGGRRELYLGGVILPEIRLTRLHGDAASVAR